MKQYTTPIFVVLVAVLALVNPSSSLGFSMTWTNSSDVWTSPTAWTTNLFTGLEPIGLTNSTCSPTATSNVTATCTGGTGGFPGINDQARFTNNTSYTVTINVTTNLSTLTVSNTAGTVTLDAGVNTLTITGRTRIADGFATSTVVWASGTLSVPGVSGGGTPTFQVGSAGGTNVGTFIVAGGTVYGGGSISLGTAAAQVGRLVVSGPGVFTNVVGQAPNLNLQFRLRSAGCQLIVTNGGKFLWSCITRATSNSLVLVSDPGSLLRCTNVAGATENLSIGMNDGAGPGSLMIVSNGATVMSDGTLSIGRGGSGGGQFSAYNTGIVVGAGSKLIVSPGSSGDFTHLIIGSGSIGGSHYNNLTVYDGGNLQCNGPFFSIPNANPATNNSFNMGGVGAMSTGLAFAVRNNSGGQNSSILVTNAVFTCTSVSVVGIGGQSLSVLAKGTLNVTAPSALTTNLDNSLSVSGSGGGTITINAGTINAASGTNGTDVSIGNDTSTGNSLIITNGGNLFADNITVRGTNSISFTSGTVSTGGMTIHTNVNNDVEFVVGNGINAAYYDMAPGGTGFHRFRTGGSPDLVVTNGAFLRGSGTLTGTIRVLGTLVPGGAGIAGSIHCSNSLSFGSSSVMNFDLGTSSDLVTVDADLGLGSSTLNVGSLTGFGANTYTLFQHTNTVTPPSGTITVGTMPPGFTGTVSNDLPNARVVLVVTATGGGDPYSTWASFYGLTGGNAAGTADPDGDGMNNTNEFQAGFNPTNSAAYLHITNVARSGANITVTYLGASGDSNGSPGPKTNVLDVSTGTANGSYSNNFLSTGQTNILSGGTGLGTAASFIETNVTGGATRYYRVRVLVP